MRRAEIFADTSATFNCKNFDYSDLSSDIGGKQIRKKMYQELTFVVLLKVLLFLAKSLYSSFYLSNGLFGVTIF